MLNIIKFFIGHPLTKNNVVISFMRFIKWQIGSRYFFKKSIVNYVNNSKLIVSNGMSGATGNIYAGLMEFHDMSFLLHFLTKDDKFLDIGANVGVYTVLASSVRGASSIAIEPMKKTFDSLMDNILINRLDSKVKAFNIGLGSEEKTLFFKNEDTMSHVIYTNDNNISVETVEVKRLDDIVSESFDLIKIDVEGFESEVIKGGHNCFKNAKAIIIELNNSGNKYGFNDSAIHEELLSFGFLPYSYEPFSRKLNKLETFKNGGNTLYLKNLGYIENKVIKSEKFKILDYEI